MRYPTHILIAQGSKMEKILWFYMATWYWYGLYVSILHVNIIIKEQKIYDCLCQMFYEQFIYSIEVLKKDKENCDLTYENFGRIGLSCSCSLEQQMKINITLNLNVEVCWQSEHIMLGLVWISRNLLGLCKRIHPHSQFYFCSAWRNNKNSRNAARNG